MNEYALIVSLLSGTAVSLFMLGLKYFRNKELKVSRFKPFYDYREEGKYKEYEKIISRSKIPFRTTLLLIIIGGIGIGITTYIVVGIWWIALISFAGGFFIPKWWYEWHLKSNKKVMQRQMEQACEIMASVLKTGSGLTEALEKAARDIGEPLRTEFIRAAAQIRIGVPMSNAFMELTERVNIPEMTILSISIELKDGGMAINLGNLFLQLQADIRSRIQTEKEISSAASALKSAGYIVAGVPFLTITIMRLFAPAFIDPMFNDPIGIVTFLICCLIIFIGTKWMLNMAKEEESF